MATTEKVSNSSTRLLRHGELNRRDFLEVIGAGFGVPTLLGAARKSSLRGSRESMDRQNLEAIKEGLTYIKDRKQLEHFVATGLLVKIPEGSHIQVDPNLPEWRRYVRPWARKFLIDLSVAHVKQFPNAQKLTISSAVRPLDFQDSLRKTNPNASSRSVHPTGAVVDILHGKLIVKEDSTKDVIYAGMTRKEKNWIEDRLLGLESRNLVEATKEDNEPCYHVMVFKSYASPTTNNRPSPKK